MTSMHGKDLIALLKKAGFKVVGERGGHVSLKKGTSRLIIPSKEQLSDKTFQTLIEQANLTGKDVAALLAGESIEQQEEEPIEVEEDHEEAQFEEQGFFQYAWNASTGAFPLALIRVIVSILFLATAIETAPWANFGWFQDLISNMVRYPVNGLLSSFLTNVVQPQIAVFGWLHFLFNLFLGISLFMGFFSRFWSVLGFFWSLALFVLRSANPNWWIWSDIMLVGIFFMFWTMKAGRCFGIDQKLSEFFESKQDNWFYYLLSLLV